MVNDEELERLLKQAVKENCQKEMEELEKSIALLPEPVYSAGHVKAMERLFTKERRKNAWKQFIKNIGKVGLFFIMAYIVWTVYTLL